MMISPAWDRCQENGGREKREDEENEKNGQEALSGFIGHIGNHPLCLTLIL
jgi:hypothetical protein